MRRMLDVLAPLEHAVAWDRLARRCRPRVRWPWLFAHPHDPREEVYFPTALAACGVRATAHPYTYMNWTRALRLDQDEIDAVRRRDYRALPGFEVAPGRELYAVKRVPRILDDPLRRYSEALRADDPGAG